MWCVVFVFQDAIINAPSVPKSNAYALNPLVFPAEVSNLHGSIFIVIIYDSVLTHTHTLSLSQVAYYIVLNLILFVQCRSGGKTYKGQLTVRLSWRVNDRLMGSEDFSIAEIPIMVKV